MNNLRILLAAVFHFVHPLEKHSSKLHNNQWSVPPILLFAKNADSENEKRLKIKIFICIQYSTLKKGNPFLTSSRHYGNLRKVPPFLTKSRIFLGFVFDIKSCKVKQLSWVIFISHESQKSWKETFLEFFQLFAFFFKVKKSRPFSSFFVWSFWADSCQIKAGIPIRPLNLQLSKMTGNCEQWIVTLIYNCSYVGALCVPAMFQDVGRLRQD